MLISKCKMILKMDWMLRHSLEIWHQRALELESNRLIWRMFSINSIPRTSLNTFLVRKLLTLLISNLKLKSLLVNKFQKIKREESTLKINF